MPMPQAFFQFQGVTAAEPMQVDGNMEENDNSVKEQAEYVVENPTLDLEQIVSQYTGMARLLRLTFIAEHCPALRVEALRLALTHVMDTHNTTLYSIIHRKLTQAVTENCPLPDTVASTGTLVPARDEAWFETTAKKANFKVEKLDTDLKNYKSNSIKESIRRGHDDLGDHYLDCGDLQNALKSYSRARDYCTSPKHTVTLCLNVIKVNVYLKNWSHVLTYVNKGQIAPEDNGGKELSEEVMTQLNLAAGLGNLGNHNYKVAAKHFLQTSFDHCSFPELLSPSNVATYGTLCALASFDRQELHRSVITSISFKQFLELEPQLRDILHNFHNSKYASCLKMLADIKDNLLLDLHLSPHVKRLYKDIRNRALCQYFSPYLSADMHKMAEAFNTTVVALEDELTYLILDDRISARIDSHKKILYAKDTDQRNSTFEKSLALGRDYQRRTRALILRAAVLKNQIQVKASMADKNSKCLMAFESPQES